MITNDDKQHKEQQKLWNRLFKTDKFSAVIQLPRKYRHNRWNAIRTLGDGAFGEVRLLVDSENPEIVVAAKCMNTNASGKEEEFFKKLRREAFIMRIFHNSEHVIHYIGMRYDAGRIEMFLEYADGGELFDHIEPDSGMPARKAQNFFRQIIAGLKHIHSMGIVHRDIKPENLLLMKNGQLRICDFGLATIFRHKGVERKLKSKCGTVQYLSPQVLSSNYRGEPSDIWSCGIVLIALLTGELPWDEAVKTSAAFKLWLTKYDWRRQPPWDRLFGPITNLLRKMLDVCEKKRIKIPEIEEHKFFVDEIKYEIPSAETMRGFKAQSKNIATVPPKTANEPIGENPATPKENNEAEGPPNSLQKVVVENQKEPDLKQVEISTSTKVEKRLDLPFDVISQPIPSCGSSELIRELQLDALTGNFFSQPVGVELLTQIDYSVNQHPLALLARRMTRFCVIKRTYEMMSIIKERVDPKFTCVQRTTNMLSISGPRNRMCYVVTIYEMMGEDGRKVMVDCRRSRGDGIEFKRAFLDFKHKLRDVICESGNTWLQRQGLVVIS
uniref:non-specific serine/threonine protein kinase n=1 Tax=Wuchereria bancrofti TaxID=6293 RepID=A0AAF5PUY7_WUCBA